CARYDGYYEWYFDVW
nr:immunoglobulin heavy chain junction region [Mus musculus]MBK4198533.1 immunoglobulin heavy chain junction region [Mus musculus]MBK4198534.1 immunoglobulin heavy chain junction region [Mus musculus]MBK4198535.1 immunoglobulin heavy chain junction region [Mus musculus]MBK4198538.1 immunoglobulin heavy chain junction region [Mus musculus]